MHQLWQLQEDFAVLDLAAAEPLKLQSFLWPLGAVQQAVNSTALKHLKAAVVNVWANSGLITQSTDT